MARAFEAYFAIKKSVPHEDLVIERARIEGRSKNNELLFQRYRLLPENGGTRLHMTYDWGPRSLIAQLTARADLWGGAFRLKGLAETGEPNERPYQIISALVALVTGVLTLVGFAILFDWVLSLLFILALFIHELGHLVAYRLMGQPWGRMIFLPFLGAIAMPRLPFESQAQTIFAALMGPGLSTLLSIGCVIWLHAVAPQDPIAYGLGLATIALNLFNLMPAEPLDGGVALRSILSRLIGRYARFGLILAGALIGGIGLLYGQLIIVLFGGLAILANLKDRSIDAGLRPLTSLEVAISFFGYVTMITAYITMLRAITLTPTMF
jgi:Zn-dependent protease